MDRRWRKYVNTNRHNRIDKYKVRVLELNGSLAQWTYKPRGRGTQKSFILRGSAPRSNPLPFYIPIFDRKGTPFIYLLVHIGYDEFPHTTGSLLCLIFLGSELFLVISQNVLIVQIQYDSDPVSNYCALGNVTQKREGNWVESTFARTYGTVTGDRENKLANS